MFLNLGKGIEEIEERVARPVFELGRVILQAVYNHLDWRLMKKREKACAMSACGRETSSPASGW